MGRESPALHAAHRRHPCRKFMYSFSLFTARHLRFIFVCSFTECYRPVFVPLSVAMAPLAVLSQSTRAPGAGACSAFSARRVSAGKRAGALPPRLVNLLKPASPPQWRIACYRCPTAITDRMLGARVARMDAYSPPPLPPLAPLNGAPSAPPCLSRPQVQQRVLRRAQMVCVRAEAEADKAAAAGEELDNPESEAARKKAEADRLRAAEKFMVVGTGEATCKVGAACVFSMAGTCRVEFAAIMSAVADGSASPRTSHSASRTAC